MISMSEKTVLSAVHKEFFSFILYLFMFRCIYYLLNTKLKDFFGKELTQPTIKTKTNDISNKKVLNQRNIFTDLFLPY